METCLWRIDMLSDSIRDRCPSEASGTCGAHPAAVKPSDQPTAPRLPAQTATGLIGSAVCRCPLDTPGSTSLGRIRQPLVCDRASTVALPSIGMEIGDGSRQRRALVRCSPLQCSMGAMIVEVCPEIEQVVFEIRSGPEQRAVQVLASNRADQPFHKRMG